MTTSHSALPHKKKRKHSKIAAEPAPAKPSDTQQQPGRYQPEEGSEAVDTACVASFHGVTAGTSELWLLQLPDSLTANSLNGVKLKLSTTSAEDKEAGLVGRFTDRTGSKYALSEEEGNLAKQLHALVPSGAGEVHSYPFAKRLTVVHDLLSLQEAGTKKATPNKSSKKAEHAPGLKDGKEKVHKKDKAAKSEDSKRAQKKHSSSRTPAPAQHKVPAAGLQQTPAPPGNLATSLKTPKRTPLAEASPAGREKGGSSRKEPKQSAAAPSAGTSEKKKKKERRDSHSQAETAAAAAGGEQPGGSAKGKKDKGDSPQAGGSSKKAKKRAAAAAEGSTKKKETKRALAEVQQPEGSVKKRKKQQQQANN